MVRMISPIVETGKKAREGKGFSKAELNAVGLTHGNAKSYGIPSDPKRGSSHDENVEALKEYMKEAKDLDIKVSKPKMTSKPHVGRAYRARTSAGQKIKGLRKHKGLPRVKGTRKIKGNRQK